MVCGIDIAPKPLLNQGTLPPAGAGGYSVAAKLVVNLIFVGKADFYQKKQPAL
jgi:hypothetical protein